MRSPLFCQHRDSIYTSATNWVNGHECGCHTEWAIEQTITDDVGVECQVWYAACTPHMLHYVKAETDPVRVLYVFSLEDYPDVQQMPWFDGYFS